MNEGIIFDIKKYAIHDGPGIRTTVFLKGCPLNCWWCHNPESQKLKPEIMVYPDRCINSCTLCVEKCPQNAIKKNRDILIDQDKCDLCGECEKICPSEAIKISGKKVSVKYIMEEIDKDVLFYNESSGGITFSGGEPLLQIEFLKNLLQESKKRYLTTVVDTSGYIDFSYFEKINDLVDIYFYDIKLVDNNFHKRYTGVSNKIIFENLIKLSKIHNNIEVRIPLIEGITDTDENIKGISNFLKKVDGIKNLSFLNYHKGGIAKYERLGIKYKLPNIKPLPEDKLLKIKNNFEKEGFIVKIGG